MYDVSQIYLKRSNLKSLLYLHMSIRRQRRIISKVAITTTSVRGRNEVVLSKKKTDSGNKTLSEESSLFSFRGSIHVKNSNL